MTKERIIFPIILIMVLAVSRWPHLLPSNFSAVYALAFVAGVYLPGRLGWIIPLLTLFVTDLVINSVYGVALLHPSLMANYIAYVGMIALGRKFGPGAKWVTLVGGGLLSAVIFYIVTNTGAWLWNPLYPKSFSGWVQALTVGIPNWPHTWEFFRNTLLSGGLFAGLFAGAMKLSASSETAEEKEEETSDAGEEQPRTPAEAGK